MQCQRLNERRCLATALSISCFFVPFQAQSRAMQGALFHQRKSAVSRDPLISSRESQKATGKILVSLLSMMMRFEIPSSGLKPQALRRPYWQNRKPRGAARRDERTMAFDNRNSRAA